MGSLTLKFRPKSFAEVVGQEAVVSILSRQVATGTFKNAYLFCGFFGCGKTTVARIMSNAINNGEGEPIEIDAASHNGIDDVRRLIIEAQQPPIDCDYKVFVIDEAQNMTKAAWDCALKLIEEPPKHAVFIFCTTNPQKIPETILSRVQRFDFKRVPSDVIADRLEFILNEETDSKYERAALESIASLSDGHVRDAIQYLEKCLDAVKEITLENVETVLGLIDKHSLLTIENCVLSKDLDGCMAELEKVVARSYDPLRFFDSMIEFAIDCAILAKTGAVVNTSIPTSFKDSIVQNKEMSLAFMERLVELRKFCDRSSVYTLIKVIFVEMCDQGEKK